jgi:hypothetical protein
LLLNQEDELQKSLWDIADKIYNTDKLAERTEMDVALVKAGRAVFDAEWKKIEAEMKGEGFQG